MKSDETEKQKEMQMVLKNKSEMDTQVLYAFLDESGNSDLNVENKNATNLYICVAVLVNNEQLVSLRRGVAELSNKYFSGSNIKSSSIGTDTNRRIKILSNITNMNFRYYALVVNKELLNKDSGFKYKTSFYKCINRMLYRKLVSSGAYLHVIADYYGDHVFMESFRTYLGKQGQLELGLELKFEKSANEPIIQIADLIAGSLQYVYDKDKKGSYSTEIINILKEKQLGVFGWPIISFEGSVKECENEYDLDDIIRESCIRSVRNFQNEYDESEDVNRQMQIAVLNHLLFLKELKSENEDDAIYADGLIEHLENLSFPKLSKLSLSSRVIGPLRDAGLVIAGSNEGYRLAMSSKNITLYLEHDKAIIVPMLRRLKIARETILLATGTRYDILSAPEYIVLKSLMDTYENHFEVV